MYGVHMVNMRELQHRNGLSTAKRHREHSTQWYAHSTHVTANNTTLITAYIENCIATYTSHKKKVPRQSTPYVTATNGQQLFCKKATKHCQIITSLPGKIGQGHSHDSSFSFRLTCILLSILPACWVASLLPVLVSGFWNSFISSGPHAGPNGKALSQWQFFRTNMIFPDGGYLIMSPKCYLYEVCALSETPSTEKIKKKITFYRQGLPNSLTAKRIRNGS